MKVTTRRSEKNPKVCVAALAGMLDTQASSTAQSELLGALDQSEIGLLMDLTALKFITSAGISVLLNVRKKAQDGGKRVGLYRMQPQVYKVLKIAQMDKVLALFEEEEDALQTFWPQP